jgi:hypothetical protein
MKKATRAQSARRLNLLADFLEKFVPPAKLAMKYWTEDTATGGASAKMANECGTAGCAVGWGMTIPVFRAEGLKAGQDTWNDHCAPKYEGQIGWRAACAFFGVTWMDEGEGDYLFSGRSYPRKVKPAAVAKRLREFAKTRKVPAKYKRYD